MTDLSGSIYGHVISETFDKKVTRSPFDYQEFTFDSVFLVCYYNQHKSYYISYIQNKRGGQTPLYMAVKKENLPVVKLLLENGANQVITLAITL